MTNGSDATRVRLTPGNWIGMVAVLLTFTAMLGTLAVWTFFPRAEAVSLDAKVEGVRATLASHQESQALADTNVAKVLERMEQRLEAQQEMQATLNENQIRFGMAVGLQDIRRPKRGGK